MLSYLITVCFYRLFLLIITSCTLAGPFLPLWGKPQGFGVPTGQAARDTPAPRVQGAKAMAAMPLPALEGSPHRLAPAHFDPLGARCIAPQPTPDPAHALC